MSTIQISEDTFTTKGLAARWNCSTLTVKRRLKSGKLKAIRHGRIVRIPREEVQRFESASMA